MTLDIGEAVALLAEAIRKHAEPKPVRPGRPSPQDQILRMACSSTYTRYRMAGGRDGIEDLEKGLYGASDARIAAALLPITFCANGGDRNPNGDREVRHTTAKFLMHQWNTDGSFEVSCE